MYGQVINLLTLVSLWTVFGVAGTSVTNLLTLAGLWTLFGPWQVYQQCHRPAYLGRSMDTFWIGVTNLLTLAGLFTLFGLVRPSVTNLLTLAGLWRLFG